MQGGPVYELKTKVNPGLEALLCTNPPREDATFHLYPDTALTMATRRATECALQQIAHLFPDEQVHIEVEQNLVQIVHKGKRIVGSTFRVNFMDGDQNHSKIFFVSRVGHEVDGGFPVCISDECQSVRDCVVFSDNIAVVFVCVHTQFGFFHL